MIKIFPKISDRSQITNSKSTENPHKKQTKHTHTLQLIIFKMLKGEDKKNLKDSREKQHSSYRNRKIRIIVDF